MKEILILTFLCVLTSAQADLTNGLVAYFPFNGNANDESGNGYNGSVRNAVLCPDRFGNPNSAYSFNGSNSYIRVAQQKISAYPFTWSVWFMANGRGRILTLGERSSNLFLYFNRGVWFYPSGFFSPPLDSNRWYALVGTTDAKGNGWLFINGVCVAKGFLPSSSQELSSFYIGSVSNVWQGISGVIDDVRVYNRALSPSEVQELYETEAGPLGQHRTAVLTTLYSFTGTNDGFAPYGGLVQGSDGNLYGTTSGGGLRFPVVSSAFKSDTNGTVFSISTNGVLRTLFSFAFTNGAQPRASMILANDGNFYGTTYAGGSVFRLGLDGVLTTLGHVVCPNGLVQGRDGNLYGTTAYGGLGAIPYDPYNRGNGTVFRISTNGTLSTLYMFPYTWALQHGYGPWEGSQPSGGVVQGIDGNFYGTTQSGGLYTNGTVFKMSVGGTVSNLYSFTGGNDGGNPNSGLVMGSDGNLYGTTPYGIGPGGWIYGNGTVFKVNTNGVLTTLSGFPDGKSPLGALVQGSDGFFYGTTQLGGTVDCGTIFAIGTNGVLTSIYSFTGGSDGANPCAGLVQGSDGSFYGTTYAGGLWNAGTVFRVTVAPAQPQLSIQPVNPPGWVTLMWPSDAIGYALKVATSCGPRATWTPISQVPTVINAQNRVTTFAGTQRFYRLSQ